LLRAHARELETPGQWQDPASSRTAIAFQAHRAGEKKPLHERITQRYFAPDYSGARPGPIKDVLCLLGTAKLLPGSAQSSQQELLQRLA